MLRQPPYHLGKVFYLYVGGLKTLNPTLVNKIGFESNVITHLKALCFYEGNIGFSELKSVL